MALSNYTLTFGGGAQIPSPFIHQQQQPHQVRTQFSDLLYTPDDQQRHKNEPFSQPEQRRIKIRRKPDNMYLPPRNQYANYENTKPESTNYNNFYQERYNQYDNVPGNNNPYVVQQNAYRDHANYGNEGGVKVNSNLGQQGTGGYTRVEAGSDGKTRLHAVLDYDGDDYYDDGSLNDGDLNIVSQQVTPLQGPILLKNGTVPVVPLNTYNKVNTINGTLYQIPIFWTALSLALGYELQGQIIKGVPCVKRDYQLFCPTAGNTYPLDKIEHFIDENKALMKRMYGAFSVRESGGGGGSGRRRRSPDTMEHQGGGESYFRHARQSHPVIPPPANKNTSSRIDACQSKTEIITPYWALNAARKLRAIVNTQHFEQAIHQEVCTKKSTTRCTGDCGCEQKYKWHRLLAYDPDEDCAGIFMDWFLFPSCCVCRCDP